MGLTVSQKVDNYAKSHVKELRDVENKNGRPMTKDDVVEYMMKKGVLTQGDYNIWYNSTEGSNSRMNKLSRTSSVWTQSGSAMGAEAPKSYLDEFKEDSCIPDLGDTYKKSVDRATKSKTTTFSVKREMEKQKFQDYLNSLPPVTASYTDLMRSIKFENASPSERIDMMLQQAGERFQVAREQGDTNQMGKLLLDGLMLSFQKIDSELGITYVKEGMKNANIVRVIEQAVSAMVNDGDNSNTTSMEKFWNSIKESDAFQAVKSYGGFNDIIAQIDKLVDDGDPNNLGFLEKSWDGLKGVGQFADNFVGTQGVVVLAAYALIMQAAVAGGSAIGAKVIGGEAGAIIGAARTSQVISAGFAGAGLYHTASGAVDLINAETHEEAQAAGAKIAQGALEIYGGYRGLKAGIEMYKAGKFQQMKALEQENALAEARKLFGFEDGVEITETALKQAYKKASLRVHPDRGGSTEAFQAVKDAYGLLKDNLAAANKVTGFKTPATEPAPQNAPDITDITVSNIEKLPSIEVGKDYEIYPYKATVTVNTSEGVKTFELDNIYSRAVEIRENYDGTLSKPQILNIVTIRINDVIAGKATDPVIQSNLLPNSSNTALVTRENVVALKTEGYNVTITPQNQILAYDASGKTVEVGTIGKTSIAEVRANLQTVKPQSATPTTQASPEATRTEYMTANPELLGAKPTTEPTPTTVTNVTGRVTTENGGLTVTRPNGTQVDLFAGIPQEVLNAPAKNYMKFPDATTVPENFGVSLTQHASAPIEAQYIPTGKTVAETLELANKSGVPLKFDVQKQAFYQDAPYGGKQYVNTESITPIYTHEAEPNWSLAKNYVQEYGHEVITPDGPKTYAVDRAVVTANPNPTDNGLSANCAGKQYDIVYPDGTRKPYSPDLVKPGEPFKISKREGVELKMAVFDKPTTSAEGETLPAGKLMMIDADGHPYDGNPVKRLRSGEVEMQFDETDPVQAQMKQTLDKIKDLDTQTKAAKKAGNKDLANQHKDQADGLAKELDAQLTEFVKAKQNPTVPLTTEMPQRTAPSSRAAAKFNTIAKTSPEAVGKEAEAARGNTTTKQTATNTTENTPTVRSAESSSYAQHLEQTFGNNPKYEIVVKRCNEIKEQFGVEVQFNGLPDGDVGASVTEIYNELQNFKMHNADGSKKLVTVNITDENQTYWDGNNNSINIGTNGKLNVNDVRAALRHELVHDYDTKPELGNEFPTTFDKNNIEPYIQEMLNAGLSPEEIIYAFGNRKELLSVVAMCDMSKLSEGFKTVLKDAGMPENVLNMKTNNAVSQNTYTPQQVRTNTQTITNAIVQKGGVGYAPSTNGQYKNLYSTAMMLNSIAETYEYVSGSNGTSSKNETKTNKTNEPRHTYASEMDLEELNSELYGTKIKINGNKVTIKNQGILRNYEQTVEIPEEYFEGCKTNKDRLYLVKRWLVESNHDDNIDNIPYELLKAANDTRFYDSSNHSMYMGYVTKLREAGIKIGKFEKSKKRGKPNIINLEVYGTKYRMETFVQEKSDIILGASSILGSPFNDYPFAKVMKNIIDSSSGKYVREGSYETFIPKLLVGVPTLKNKSIINHGTAHEKSVFTNKGAMYQLSKAVVGHFDEENVKEIFYIEDSSSFSERKEAYSYYDDVNDDQYLYLFDEGKIFKQDSDGNIYQKQITYYEHFPWEKVNEY